MVRKEGGREREGEGREGGGERGGGEREGGGEGGRERGKERGREREREGEGWGLSEIIGISLHFLLRNWWYLIAISVQQCPNILVKGLR